MLARNGIAPLGDLRYLADTKLDDLATPIAKAQLAAALGLLGDRARAERVYQAALADIAAGRSRAVRPHRLRLGAARRRRASWRSPPKPAAPRADDPEAVQRIEAARALAPYTSTQENAWLVLAARALAQGRRSGSLDVQGETRKGALYRSLPASASGGSRCGSPTTAMIRCRRWSR